MLISNTRGIPGLIATFEKVKPAFFSDVNTLYDALLNLPDFAKLDFSSLKLCLQVALHCATGDIAKVDEQGYYFLLDRRKDMILVSGFNVFPNEIEDVVAMHPGVLEAAVVGMPDEKCGEAVRLVVVRKDPDLSAEDLRAHC